MLVGITTNGKIGLGIMAVVFIGFALLVSFVFPRRNPDFPGDRLRGFIWVTVLLFAAMMVSVFYFAREAEGEEHVVEAEAAQETTETGGPAETGPAETGPAETGPAETGGQPPAGGDATAGAEIFAASGCGSCHTLEAAGTSGTIGPNLDEAQPDFELVVDRVTNGKAPMPPFAESLSEQQIDDVAAYVVESTSG